MNLGNDKENKIREAILTHKSHNEDWEFEVLENGGVVTLTGSVPSQKDAREIESIVTEQPGVFTVINELRVDNGGDTANDDVKIIPPPQ